jgi:phytoene dehydrogenase-like protein
MWPLIRRKKTWFDLNLDQYSERFQNPLLRSAIRASFAPDFPAFFLVITMAGLANGSSRYPIGGSLAIARRIEQRYRRLGGSIRYGAAVDRILVEDDRAVGVRLEDGTELRADYVIGAGDVHHAVNHMLEGRYGADWLEDLEDRLAVFPTMLLISLGVNQSYADHPAQALGTYHVLDRPLGHAAVDPRIVLTHVYSFERGDCADGKTVFTIATLVDYEHWTGLRRSDPERYEREKEDVARRIIRSLDRHYPGLEQNVEMIDVATPATFERYTFNWRGSIEGWLLRPSDLTARVSKTLPGLERFYQVGHWIEPGGGLPMAAASGRWGVQLICRAEGRRFRTRLPDAADAASEPAHASI